MLDDGTIDTGDEAATTKTREAGPTDRAVHVHGRGNDDELQDGQSEQRSSVPATAVKAQVSSRDTSEQPRELARSKDNPAHRIGADGPEVVSPSPEEWTLVEKRCSSPRVKRRV